MLQELLIIGPMLSYLALGIITIRIAIKYNTVPMHNKRSTDVPIRIDNTLTGDEPMDYMTVRKVLHTMTLCPKCSSMTHDDMIEELTKHGYKVYTEDTDPSTDTLRVLAQEGLLV